MSNSKVIVVGGGLAGLSAAHTLYERGANVLVLDKNPFFGGNSTKATSGINGAGTQSQQTLEIPDTAKIFYDDTLKSARDLARPDLIKALTYKSADAVNWLQDRFKLDLSKVSRLGGHSQPRTHRGSQMFPGMTITYAQMEKLEDLAETDPTRIQIIRKARVTKLIYEGGKVQGVEYEHEGGTHKEFGPVILATGGYAADFNSSDSLLKRYRPELLPLPTTNGDHCTGDGQKMVEAIGGNLVDMEKVQVHPTGLQDPNDADAKVKFLAAEALRGVGGLLLDSKGQRFADELGHRDYVTGRIWENKNHPIRLVLNGASSKEIEWHCKHYTGRGLMKKFISGAEVAKEIGISPETLKKSFDEYNDIVDGKKKDPFGKRFFHGGKFRMDDTFHVALMTPVLHFTMGGAATSDKAEALFPDKKPIPGLFLAGEIAGGVHGANRLGGSSLLGCVVFGRIAGEAASSYLLKDLSAGQVATRRLEQVSSHIRTNVVVDPESKKLTIQFDVSSSPSDAAGPLASQTAAVPAQSPAPTQTSAPQQKQKTESGEKELKEYSLDDVAKHNKDDDVWVAVNGQVLDVTKFLPDHPGGPKAILLYKGRDASEEFNMLHDPSVIKKYAPDSIIGTLKK